MKNFTKLVFAFTLLSATSAFAQQGPLLWTEPIKVESNSIFIMWMENAGYTSSHCYQKVYGYNYNSNGLSSDSVITATPRKEDSRLGGGSYTDAATGKFNIGPRDQVVSIWGGEIAGTSKINIMIPHFDTTETMWTNSTQDSIDGDIQNDRMYVRTIDIDGDSLDEFIVAFLDGQDSVHFYLYDVDSTFHPTLISSFTDEKVIGSFSYQFVRYYVETGDFNGDGTDELALLWVEPPLDQVLFDVKIKFYDFDGSSFIPKGEDEISIPYSNPLQEFVMAAKSGNYKNDEKIELAFTAVRQGGGYWESYHFVFETTADLQTINQSNILLNFDPTVEGLYQHLSLASGDLGSDGLDELIFTTQKTIYVMSADDDLNLTLELDFDVTSGGGYEIKQKYNFLEVSDVNQDGRNDIIIIKDFVDNNQQEDGFYVAMYTVDTSNVPILIGELFGDEQLPVDLDDPDYEFRPYSIAIGNFDGLNFTIGEPTHYVASSMVQPIVILNAPPVHFDMFGEDIFDINKCYNGDDCDFAATYKKTSSSSIEVSTTVESDWAVSAGLSISGATEIGASVVAAPLGAGAEASASISINYENHLLLTHGENFSNTSTNSTTVTVSVEVGASEDDLIYSTVTEYDIWEYPVYHGNETFARNTILTFVPNNVQATWFPSKSYNAVNYVPDHEVSNILSYQPFDNLNQNPNSEQIIQADYTSDSFVLGSSSDYTWNITKDEFTSNQADTVKENGIDIGITYGIFRFDGDYNQKSMSTHKTTIFNQIDLEVHLGSVDLGIGDTKYTVTPYSYWGNNDALVIDYAVKPEIAPPGFPETWWQENYGIDSDPTFILPWRLDPEKGFALSEPAKRHQSKDIIFSPANPLPEDTLTIIARVRNFSLLPTPEEVSVSFYIGDPDEGGIPIYGLNGSNTVYTSGPISERGRSDVEFIWIVPSDLQSFPRIYAVLDEGDMIPEIHADNNKGFNVLGYASGSPTDVEDVSNDDGGYMLGQSYPNPFRDYTNIEYTIPNRERTTIKVFDHTGREVATLIDKVLNAGNYIVPFNAIDLASGIYIYTIQSGNYSASKKMVVLK